MQRSKVYYLYHVLFQRYIISFVSMLLNELSIQQYSNMKCKPDNHV